MMQKDEQEASQILKDHLPNTLYYMSLHLLFYFFHLHIKILVKLKYQAIHLDVSK